MCQCRIGSPADAAVKAVHTYVSQQTEHNLDRQRTSIRPSSSRFSKAVVTSACAGQHTVQRRWLAQRADLFHSAMACLYCTMSGSEEACRRWPSEGKVK